MTRRLFLPTTLILLATAQTAGGFSLSLESRAPTAGLQTSDTVAIDVFLEGAGSPTIADLSVAVLWDSGHLTYDPTASAGLPIIHPAPALYTTGAQAGYLFYNAHAGILYPSVAPAFGEWPSPPTGRGQVNLEYDFVGSLPYTFPSGPFGPNYWIGSLVFHVDDASLASEIELSVTAGGAGIEASVGSLVDPATVSLGAPIIVPEPTTWVLIGAGLLLTRVRVKR
jgi:hypothetical protein